jgi:small subunit ribosomal protein S3
MDIDYASVFAQTVYGKIGVKVWICKGEVLGKRDLNPNVVVGGGKEGERGFDRMGDRPDRRGGGDRDRGGDRRGGGGRGKR